jgi:hypothetical protein
LTIYDWWQRLGLRIPQSQSDTAAMQYLCLTALGLYFFAESLVQLSLKAAAKKRGAVTVNIPPSEEQLLREQLDEAGRAREALSRQQENLSRENAELKRALSEVSEKMQQVNTAKAPDESGNAAVLSFLSLLQQKGRFIDFIMDDIAPYDDAQVGAAARVVHQGCAQLVREHFSIVPVHNGTEGERIELPQGFNVEKYRLLGRVGEPPFRGVVLHRGWRAGKVNLPKTAVSSDAREVIAPAEVELS